MTEPVAQTTMTDTNEADIKTFINGMIKAELHVHLENVISIYAMTVMGGCLTPSLARKFARRNKLSLPAHLASLDQTDGYSFHDLSSFLSVYYPNLAVCQTEADFRDLAYDYLTRANAQNVRHCELFFDPQAHTSRGIPFPTVLLGYRAGLQLAQRTLGISASLIMCFLRDESANYAMSTLMSALPFKDSIIGVGLDSDERNNPPSKFAAVYQRASREGFLLTAHADIDQQNTLEHIRQLLLEVQVDRIDHGTNILDSSELTQHLLQRGIGLTCCPISNSIVTADFKGKEILELLRRGIKVTIASDDPAYFRGYLNENLHKLATETDVTRQELLQLQRNAFNISWISSWKRNHFLAQLDEYEKQTIGASAGTRTN